MKADIEFPSVKGVSVAVAMETDELNQTQWRAFIINENDFALTNVIIASTGYGLDAEGNQQRTSTLRHLIEELPAQSAAPIELIQQEVMHLVNEYWVSYYTSTGLFDKKFLFLPDTILAENVQHLPLLDMPGILHS